MLVFGILIKIGSLKLHEFQNVSISENLLSLIEPSSRYLLKNMLNSWQNLDFRSLHYMEVQTPESFLRQTFEAIAENIDAANISVYSYFNDEVVIDLAKSYFSIIEMQKLEIFQFNDLCYTIHGRVSSHSIVNVIFLDSSDLSVHFLKSLQGQIFIIIALENGLFDLEPVLSTLSNIFSKRGFISFKQISSKISDSYLIFNFSCS